MLPISLVVLLIVSILLVVGIYTSLSIEDVINRQLLFGVVFQIWGIMATVLIVKKVLNIRDTQRWEAINEYVLGFLNLKTYGVLGQAFGVLGIEIEAKEKPTIKKTGVEFLNPEYTREWYQKTKQELEKILKEDAQPIKKNIEKWKPSTHKEFSEIMKSFNDGINELLISYPHQIPPELLSKIVCVRERARGLSNLSKALSSVDFMKEKGYDYKEVNFNFAEMESKDVFDLFTKMLTLLNVLEKNLSSKWKF